MRWRWRACDPPPQTNSADDAMMEQAEDSLRQAEKALGKVQQQKKDGQTLAEVLAAIRQENHFREIWNNGMRS